MALHPSRQEELRQLLVFRDLVNNDPRTEFQIAVTREALDYSQLKVTFTGLTTLICDGSGHRRHRGPISARYTIPAGHAATSRVGIDFLPPVPFHPHVGTSGWICWGSVAGQHGGSWTLTLWTIALLEMLQFNQDSFIGINPQSPANGAAERWRQQNSGRISREVPQIDLGHIRRLSSKAG